MSERSTLFSPAGYQRYLIAIAVLGGLLDDRVGSKSHTHHGTNTHPNTDFHRKYADQRGRSGGLSLRR